MATILPSRARPATPWAARRAGSDYGAHDQPDWREIDWRPYLRDVEIASRRVRYVDLGEGDGPPFLLVHGLSGNWQNWLENIPRLAAERRVVALDLPGFGQSDDPAERITMPRYGRAVNELAETLDLGEVVLVGNSMGGFVAAETAIQFPARVERLVLVSAAGITSSDLRREPVMVWGRAAMMAGARGAAEKRMAIVRPRIRHAVYSAIMRHPSLIAAETLWEMSEGAGRSAFAPALEAILDYDFRDRLPEISAPTLIVWGENDMLIPVGDAEEYERLIPSARRLVLRDTGHVSMIERPPTFNEALIEFAREPRGQQTDDVGEPTPEVAEAQAPAADADAPVRPNGSQPDAAAPAAERA
jgi:pimeloyl-ACP methyl ester carboxylesterase